MFYIHISLNFKTTSRGRYDHIHSPVNDSSNKSMAQDLTAGKVQKHILLLYCFPKEITGPFRFKDFIANHHDETGREEHLQQVWGVTKSSLIKSLSETRGSGGATIRKKNNSRDTGSFSLPSLCPLTPCPPSSFTITPTTAHP